MYIKHATLQRYCYPGLSDHIQFSSSSQMHKDDFMLLTSTLPFYPSTLLAQQIRIARRTDCDNRLILQVFAHSNGVTQTLSSPRLQDQISRQTLRLCRFKRTKLDRSIRGISRNG
jgi:hypothetical protein